MVALERWPSAVAFCNVIVNCSQEIPLCDVSWAMAFCGVELSICVALIALRPFYCNVSIDTDISVSYKCGHCSWIGGKAPRRLYRARLRIRCCIVDPEGGCWEDNPRKLF